MNASTHPAETGPTIREAHIPTLDGWRAIAVLLVIGAHAVPMLNTYHGVLAQSAVRIFEHAGYGVDIFFSISGFLITTLLLREKAAAGIDLKSFYLRRVFRILPPIVVYLAAIVGLAVFGLLPVVANEVTAVLLFFRNYASGSWYTGHFWSLGVEEHFYIVIPIVLSVLGFRKSVVFALLTVALSVACRYLEAQLLGDVKVEFRTESRVDALMWGALLGIVLQSRPLRLWMIEHLRPARLLVLTLLAAFVLLSLHSMPVRRTVVAMIVPLVICYTVLHPGGLVGRILENRGLRWIGKLSYSLYIWQMLFFVPVVDLPLVQNRVWSIALTLSLALLSYHAVEQPSIRLGRRLQKRVRRSTWTTPGVGLSTGESKSAGN